MSLDESLNELLVVIQKMRQKEYDMRRRPVPEIASEALCREQAEMSKKMALGNNCLERFVRKTKHLRGIGRLGKHEPLDYHRNYLCYAPSSIANFAQGYTMMRFIVGTYLTECADVPEIVKLGEICQQRLKDADMAMQAFAESLEKAYLAVLPEPKPTTGEAFEKQLRSWFAKRAKGNKPCRK
jgi:hypothetical protein